MDILQLNAMALDARIAQEVDGNPALEALPTEDEMVQASSAEAPEDDRPEGERAMTVEEGGASEFERLDNLVREYDWIDDDAEYYGKRSRARGMEEGDGKLEAMANTAARPIGLQEHLLNQWSLTEVEEPLRTIGAAIIENLDESGRLTMGLADVPTEIDPPPPNEQLEQALREVQQLDPPGIGACSLQECLLLQLAALPGDNGLERRLLTEQFDNLQRNRLPLIAKALDADVEEIKAAIEVISHLSLSPGTDVAQRQLPAVVPDVIVEYDADGDRYDVRLTRSNTRELRISPEFRRMLERSRDDKHAREFIKQKIESANAIIDAIRFRRDRLLDVAKAVVESQRGFLDRGDEHLKVLRMSDLAKRFGCDPSTISRTVDEKYMQTPRGIYPLRQFFTGGAED